MKILVPLKRVIHPYVKIRFKADGGGVEMDHVKMAMNPFDEIALEEALRWKEQGQASEVICVSIGASVCQEILRTALAMGADRAMLVETQELLQPRQVAQILKSVVAQVDPRIVILGKQAIDDDANQTGQMLAAALDWPQATFASKVALSATHAVVTREVDGGLETLQVELPAVITTDLRLNDPRQPSLPNIMKAKQKPLEVIPLSQFQFDTHSRLRMLKVEAPPARKAGIKVDSVAALVDKLKHEAKVI